MNESHYIQEVHRLAGTLKDAVIRYKEEEDNARKIYESECNAADAELQTMREKSGINLTAAKETLKNISSHELLNDLEFKIHKETIEKSVPPAFIANGNPVEGLKKNNLIAIETSQKIDEKVKELHRLIIRQQQMRKWRNTFLIILGISAAILIFKVAESIDRQRQVESHYAKAVAAYEANNWENAHVNFKKVLSINKNFKNALPLLKDCYSQLRLLHQNRPKITVLGTMEFVWIPGGCFNMGSPPSEEGHRIDEEPVHEVCVDGFWMGKTEVTNEEYRKWIPSHRSGGGPDSSLDSNNLPAVMVNWEAAKAFAAWLTANSNKGYKFRLPTEAEWEYAARAGTTTSRYWGDDPDKYYRYANFKKSNLGKPNYNDGYDEAAPVGSFLPNKFGLFDILGNVGEWCEDSYSESAYKKHALINPLYTNSGNTHLIRGGSWSLEPEYGRSAIRIHLRTGDIRTWGFVDAGFRLVMTE